MLLLTGMCFCLLIMYIIYINIRVYNGATFSIQVTGFYIWHIIHLIGVTFKPIKYN